MSAPHTNIETQERRHAVPMAGIKGVLVFAGVLLVALLTWIVADSTPPVGAAEQIDARTGEVVAGPGADAVAPATVDASSN